MIYCMQSPSSIPQKPEMSELICFEVSELQPQCSGNPPNSAGRPSRGRVDCSVFLLRCQCEDFPYLMVRGRLT